MIKSGGPGSESLRLNAESEAWAQVAATTTDPVEAEAAKQVAKEKAGDAQLAAAYTYLQRTVGLIAISLPPALVAIDYAFGGTLRGSISAYYYTRAGNVFVGALCALAVFFLSYNYEPLQLFKTDSLLSKGAFVAAVCVAIFPTASRAVVADGGERLVSTLHLISAGVLFSLLGVFAYFRFTMTSPTRAITDEKKRRNTLYRVCGIAIFVSIALVGLTEIPALRPPNAWHHFWLLETICVEAFGISWLVKGGFMGWLADKNPAEDV